MIDSGIAWESERPIYARMPECYHMDDDESGNGGVSNALLSYWDQIFSECLAALNKLPAQFDPSLCDPDNSINGSWLDFLAPICGWTIQSGYYDTNYPESAKRLLLKNSFSLIWSNKGSMEVLDFVLNAFGIEHEIQIPGSFILGRSHVSVDHLGLSAWEFVVLLPHRYIQNGNEWRTTQKMVDLFSPAWCKSTIVYYPDNELNAILTIRLNTLATIHHQ